MDKQYKVVFNFYKNGDYENVCNDTNILLFKDLVTPIFVEVRNKVISVTNDLLEEWNKEFNVMHPNMCGLTTEYENFIIRKTKPFVNVINKRYGFTKKLWWLDYEMIYEGQDECYADFVFKIKLGNDIYSCVITLKEM